MVQWIEHWPTNQETSRLSSNTDFLTPRPRIVHSVTHGDGRLLPLPVLVSHILLTLHRPLSAAGFGVPAFLDGTVLLPLLEVFLTYPFTAVWTRPQHICRSAHLVPRMSRAHACSVTAAASRAAPQRRLLGPKQWAFLFITITCGHVTVPLRTCESTLSPSPPTPRHFLSIFYWSCGCIRVNCFT